MAAISFDVSYTQANDGNNGSITLNHGTKLASGRLDEIGDFVYADGFYVATPSKAKFDTTVECVRTSSTTMQIRILFHNAGPSSSTPSYGALRGVEKIIDDVPINFE